jgi:hypothetical protein
VREKNNRLGRRRNIAMAVVAWEGENTLVYPAEHVKVRGNWEGVFYWRKRLGISVNHGIGAQLSRRIDSDVDAWSGSVENLFRVATISMRSAGRRSLVYISLAVVALVLGFSIGH